jgi:hypothetical protein
MPGPILEYERPSDEPASRRNDLAYVAPIFGAMAWFHLGFSLLASLLGAGAATCMLVVGVVFGVTGALLGTVAVLIGPNRLRAAVWLAVQVGGTALLLLCIAIAA